MSSKYIGLPDIDTAADVFETADEPDSLLKPTESDVEDKAPKASSSEGLDQTGLPDRRKAGKVFGRNTRKLPKFPPLHSYSDDNDSDNSGSESYVRPLESTTARIRRLKAELAEVESSLTAASTSSATGGGPAAGPSSSPSEQSLASGPSRTLPGSNSTKRKSVLPPRTPVNLVEELSELKGRLEKLDVAIDGQDGAVASASASGSGSGSGSRWKEQLGRLQERNETAEELPPIDEKGQANGEGSTSSRRQPLSLLDMRLAVLEGALGQVEPGTPLLPTVDRLDHIMNLLTQPRHLDAISRRVKLLLVDLDRAAAAAKRNPQPSSDKPPSSVTLSQTEYTQLTSLFDLLPRLDPLLPILPPLLNRMQSLSGLHAEAADVIDGLRRLQTDQGDSSEELRDLRTLAKTVQDGLAESAKGIERNWTGVEERLKSLEERLNKL